MLETVLKLDPGGTWRIFYDILRDNGFTPYTMGNGKGKNRKVES